MSIWEKIKQAFTGKKSKVDDSRFDYDNTTDADDSNDSGRDDEENN